MKTFDAVLRGAYGTGNFGDDTLLLCMLKILGANGLSRVAIISKPASYLPTLVPEIAIEMYHPSADIEMSAAWFIWGGGTQFFSFRGWKYLAKKLGDVAANPIRFIVSRLPGSGRRGLRVHAKRKMMVGIGFGPFRNLANQKRAMRSALSCDYVLVRDRKSLEIGSQWIAADRLSLVTDICFAGSEYLTSSIQQRSPAGLSKARHRVAFVVRDWKYTGVGSSHVECVIRLAEWARKERDVEVDFIFFADDAVSRGEVARAGFTCITWDPDTGSMHDFIDTFASYDRIVTSRFHGVIFSVLLGKACMIVAIEEKLDIAYAENECGCSFWPRPFDLQVGMDAFDSMMHIPAESINRNREHKLALGKEMREAIDAKLAV